MFVFILQTNALLSYYATFRGGQMRGQMHKTASKHLFCVKNQLQSNL